MKILFKAVLGATFFALSTIGFAQVAAPYQVGTWPGFRSCAISYTFDDGCSGQFSKAIPVFDGFNYKLTLFTVSSWTSNWTNLQNAAKNGHEVANHTATHPGLNTLTEEKQENELRSSNELIDTKVTSQKSVTMATPYCAQGSDKISSKYFIATRGCQGYIEAKTPANFMNVSSVICGDQGSVKTSANFKSQADAAVTKKGWLVYLLHGVDNDGGYSPINSDTLKKSLVYLKANDSKFWVATFGDVARYIKERDCVSVKETSVTATSVAMSVTDTLRNNDIFNVPLTFRRLLPEGWSSAVVTQNGEEVNDTIVEINSVKYLQFDAVPDRGSVLITRIVPVGIKELKGAIYQGKLNVWSKNNQIQFVLPANCTPNHALTIYNRGGSKIGSFYNPIISNKIGFVDLLSKPQPGVYFVKLTDQQKTWSTRLTIH